MQIHTTLLINRNCFTIWWKKEKQKKRKCRKRGARMGVEVTVHVEEPDELANVSPVHRQEVKSSVRNDSSTLNGIGPENPSQWDSAHDKIGNTKFHSLIYLSPLSLSMPSHFRRLPLHLSPGLRWETTVESSCWISHCFEVSFSLQVSFSFDFLPDAPFSSVNLPMAPEFRLWWSCWASRIS